MRSHWSRWLSGLRPLTSDVSVPINRYDYHAPYNLTRAQKMALSAAATETLFFRFQDATYLTLDKPLFDRNLTVPNSHPHTVATCTTGGLMDPTTASAPCVFGYSNFGNASGGDFGITTESGFDHHNATDFNHLNGGCGEQYLYSYSATAADGDSGYDVNKPLGLWTATSTCDPGEGGSLKVMTGVR